MPGPVLHEARTSPHPQVVGSREAMVTATVAGEPTTAALSALQGLAGCLEVRADLAGDLDHRRLRRFFRGPLVYSLRSTAEGGRADLSLVERHRRLLAATEHFDVIDLEHERDTAPDLLTQIPAERRRLSWGGPATSLAKLMARFGEMAAVPAQLYLLVPAVTEIERGLEPLRMLKALGRADVTAFASGPNGTWTRLLAPRLGAPVIYYRGHESAALESAGMQTADELRDDYGFPSVPDWRVLYGIVGESVSPSLAPRVFNTGLRALGIDAVYLPFSTTDFGRFWHQLAGAGLSGLGLPLRGLTVVRPHKEEALSIANSARSRAGRAGAVNLLFRSGSSWQGATGTGIAGPLSGVGFEPRERSAAVVGCGGAGRAVASELHQRGAKVTLVNRGEPRAEYASRLLGLPWAHLADFDPGGFDLVVNATPLVDRSPFPASKLSAGAVVADLAYRRTGETALTAAARGGSHLVLDGRQVLVAEMGWQFELMTGHPLPDEAEWVAAGGSEAGSFADANGGSRSWISAI